MGFFYSDYFFATEPKNGVKSQIDFIEKLFGIAA